MDITPRDSSETKTLGAGKSIAVGLGIVVSAVSTLIAAFGGMEWITAHLPLLGTGLGSLLSGGVVSYIAIRRMRIDRLAKGAGLVALLLAPFVFSGCVAIRASGDGDGAQVWAFGIGSDSTAQLANVAVTGPGTEGTDAQTGVSFDAANSDQKTAQAIQSLVSFGAALAPMLAGGAPAALAASAASSADPAPAAASDAQTVYSADGYGASPGADGAGVYGRPGCARCRAWRAAHPGVELINIDEAGNRADMWAALRLRGYSGNSAALPVEIVGGSYTTSAK